MSRRLAHNSIWSPLPGRVRQTRCAAGAFTLVEILICVTILGILATIAIPHFATASTKARENTLKDELRYLRTQLNVYKAQHGDRAPGYPGGNTAAAPTAAAFTSQMTMYTDKVGATNAAASATFKFGPYLSKLPSNPVNGFSTITIVANGAPMPAPDNTSGFIYKPQTLEILPNNPGTDSAGVSYVDY